MFVLVLNKAENIPLSKNIVIVHVLFTHTPSPSKDIESWLIRVSHYIPTIRAIYCTLFNIESLSRTLSTSFEPPYTNTYHIGLSNGAVSRYILRFEIYRAKIFLFFFMGKEKILRKSRSKTYSKIYNLAC